VCNAPRLPIGIQTLPIRNLPVGPVQIDLQFQRLASEMAVLPLKRSDGELPVLARL